ncbi:MAG: ABC transporter ATP-binding protein, partial [Elusimicrobia bacterium CG03_land_8_20_14_0_80_50_18]
MDIQEMMIFENFSAGYDRGFVIRGINCRLDGGKIYALIGPNAAGKTTMLRSIIRDIPLCSGGIII